MSIKLKTSDDIKRLREGGAILARILNEVAGMIKSGVSTEELNDLAEKRIAEVGGRSSFKGYRPTWARTPFPTALCTSINNEVVHGLAMPSRILKDGDIVGIDCGLVYQERFTDMARTIAVGNVSKELTKLIRITEDALRQGIEAVRPGRKISEVAKIIQAHVENAGFSVVRELVGHGVGFAIHEEPQVPNFFDRRLPDTVLESGMVIAIEPMVNTGGWPVDTLADGWTIVTADGSHSAHFEHSVVVTENGYEILTTL
jgi:methionyl aminopeptidase